MDGYHISYNVNDAFIPIMGASMVSVLENNRDVPITFHILRTDTARIMQIRWMHWLRNGIAIVSSIIEHGAVP